MRLVAFNYIFDRDDLLRIRFELDRGQVMSFVVQLECFLGEPGWLPIVRYDTAHGFAHRDTMRPNEETEKIEIAVESYKDGLNYAIDDIKANWQVYRRRYEKWLEK
ncbi:MAG: hypothetical protein L0287_32845 [Anaerolineae bacterium]|nr:hypothetical protein [Anaerolineae bacterium]